MKNKKIQHVQYYKAVPFLFILHVLVIKYFGEEDSNGCRELNYIKMSMLTSQFYVFKISHLFGGSFFGARLVRA